MGEKYSFLLGLFFILSVYHHTCTYMDQVSKEREHTPSLICWFFVALVSSWLDFLGVQFGKWYYTGKVIPSIPSYVPWDFVLIPIFVMFLIQFKPHLSPILKGLLFAGVSAFIGEPFLNG
ncbi:hypothetical protein PMEGAPR54_55170 [Priestia megaterium]